MYEHQVITLRQHPARLLPAVTAAVGGLLAAVAVNGIAAGVNWAPFVVWVLAGFLVVRAIVDCLAWTVQYVVITNMRLILISGILSRRVTVLRLQALQNLGVTRSTGGRILGYGSFTVDVEGQARAVIDYVPYPEQVYLAVHHLLYPQAEDADGSGDSGPGGDGGPGGDDLDFDDL